MGIVAILRNSQSLATASISLTVAIKLKKVEVTQKVRFAVQERQNWIMQLDIIRLQGYAPSRLYSFSTPALESSSIRDL